jgi:hypothetical protein
MNSSGLTRFIIGISVIAALSACGGGGSSTPAPAIALSFSQPQISVGKSSTLTWSATNATSCTASGAWSGAQATSGTATETPSSGGAETFTLTCSGTGGQTTQSATLVVPIPVQASSYLNKIAAVSAIGPQPMPPEVTAGNAVAFGDFFQDGTYSMVTASCGDEYCGNPTSTNGTIHFYKMINGQWVDHTSDILSNTTGCIHPRKAIVADFNGSGKPGVFFACHGIDAPPYPGEQPHILLPQANGQYTNVTLPYTGYFHSASAADFNGNGYADVVVTDNIVHGFPYFLVNNQDGTFTQNFTRLPSVQPYGTDGSQPNLSVPAVAGAGIFTAELIDFNNTGEFDLFLGGNTPNSSWGGDWIPTIFTNNGDNTYSQSNVIELPYDSANPTVTLDVLSVNGSIYTTSDVYNMTTNQYGFSEIDKLSGSNWSNFSQIWLGNAAFPNGQTWINWIIPYNGMIDALNSTYGVSVPQ